MIFLGAGASAPFGIPTANTLTEELVDMLTPEHKELLDDIIAFWQKMYEKEPNYENILTLLMGLTNPFQKPKDSIVQAFVKDFQKHRGDFQGIIDEMYSRIVEYCTAPFVSGPKYLSPSKLEEIFNCTYDLFTLFDQETVFTTNYDPSIEIWCQKRNIEIYDNSVTMRNPEIKMVENISEGSLSAGQTNLDFREGHGVHSLKIVRLHGSVWVYETETKRKIKMNRPKDRLLFTDCYTHLNNNPCVIFPGQEPLLASGEWDVLYQYFKKQLTGNCLVIGYSFQDELINRAFLDNLDKGVLKNIGVLSPNPSEAIKNLSWGHDIPENKITRLQLEFGRMDMLQEIYSQWINRVLRIEFPNGVSNHFSAVRKNMKSYLQWI